jgi:valyl-tRNA synthetase
MPFITEEIWQNLSNRYAGESICVAAYPFGSNQTVNKVTAPKLDLAFELIQQVRNLRNSKGISPKENLKVIINTLDDTQYKMALIFIKKLANIDINYNIKSIITDNESFSPEEVEIQGGGIMLMIGQDQVFVKLNLQIDVEAEKAKIFQMEGFLFRICPRVTKENMTTARTTEGENPVISA